MSDKEIFVEEDLHGGVHVPWQKEDHEPVSNVGLLYQVISMVLGILPCLPNHQVSSEPWKGDYGNHVDCVQGCEDGEDDEPEPQGDVDLLVDDVESEHTQSI